MRVARLFKVIRIEQMRAYTGDVPGEKAEVHNQSAVEQVVERNINLLPRFVGTVQHNKGVTHGSRGSVAYNNTGSPHRAFQPRVCPLDLRNHTPPSSTYRDSLQFHQTSLLRQRMLPQG